MGAAAGNQTGSVATGLSRALQRYHLDENGCLLALEIPVGIGRSNPK
jgi:hypothetical protein